MSVGARLLRLTGRLPVKGDWAQRLVEPAFRRSSHAFRGVYDSHAAAARSAPAGKPVGYDMADAAGYYKERTTRIYPADYPMLWWLRHGFENGARRVLDLGGHIGVSYYAYQRYLDFPEDTDWTVLDVPAVCEEGRRYAQERAAPGLSFTASWGPLDDVDILFSAGALQYLENGLPDLLAQWGRPRYLLLNLLPQGPFPTFYTLQTIGVSYCPYRIESSEAFVDGLRALGYTPIDQWENPEKSCLIPFHPERSLDHYVGGFWERTK
ncbi:MAG: methyltransferase, TIGR04325 family [Myxococcota bacterium]